MALTELPSLTTSWLHASKAYVQTDTSDKRESSELGIIIFYNIFRAIESVLAGIGNVLTILIIYKYPSLHTGPHYLIASLAVADVVSALNMPLACAVMLTETSSAFLVLCPMKEFTYVLAISSSTAGIAAIAIDRCAAVVAPLRYPSIFTMKKIKILIFIMWSAAVIATLISIGSALPGIHIGQLCVFTLIVPKPVLLVVLFGSFLVLTGLTVILYLIMACVAWKKSRQVLHFSGSVNTAENLKRIQQRRITK